MKSGLDKVWSDNKVGDGQNWLGIALMLLRFKFINELKSSKDISKDILEEFITNNFKDNSTFIQNRITPELQNVIQIAATEVNNIYN
jgi:hypothetical protein